MGQAGSFRANALDMASLQAMENHGMRLDRSGDRRRIRDVDALLYDPYGHGLKLTDAHAEHVKGMRVNKGAKKVALHAFIQFPTDLEITPENEQMMLDQAVAFVNETHGGMAVFHARLDRDEEGRHGVDVFYAPIYDKTTSWGTEAWVSLSKFGRDLARNRLGQTQKEIKTDEIDPETGRPIWKPVFDDDGEPVMIWQDSSFFVGRVFQDEWFEHLRDVVGLDWVKRGERKVSRDPDRLEVEEFKVQEEAKKLAALEAKTATAKTELETARAQITEAEAARDAAEERREKNEQRAEKARAKAEQNEEAADRHLKNAETYEKRAEDARRDTESLTERLDDLRASEDALRASVEREQAELETVNNAVAQKKTKIAALQASNSSLRQRKDDLQSRLKTLNAA